MVQSGWYSQASRVDSPNFDCRPDGSEISLLVIHNISLPPGEFGGGNVQRFFTNKLDPNQHAFFEEIYSLRVSAHCLVERTGKVTQFVSFLDRAWHAGRSSFDGVAECNDYSIGVELEGTDSLPYTRSQYLSLVTLTKYLILQFPKMTFDRIAGHSEIAPDRKTDPGPAFDWAFYKNLLLN